MRKAHCSFRAARSAKLKLTRTRLLASLCNPVSPTILQPTTLFPPCSPPSLPSFSLSRPLPVRSQCTMAVAIALVHTLSPMCPVASPTPSTRSTPASRSSSQSSSSFIAPLPLSSMTPLGWGGVSPVHTIPTVHYTAHAGNCTLCASSTTLVSEHIYPLEKSKFTCYVRRNNLDRALHVQASTRLET